MFRIAGDLVSCPCGSTLGAGEGVWRRSGEASEPYEHIWLYRRPNVKATGPENHREVAFGLVYGVDFGFILNYVSHRTLRSGAHIVVLSGSGSLMFSRISCPIKFVGAQGDSVGPTKLSLVATQQGVLD